MFETEPARVCLGQPTFGGGKRETTPPKVRGRSLAALGLGYVLWDLSVVDQGGYCRGTERIWSFEPNECFPLG